MLQGGLQRLPIGWGAPDRRGSGPKSVQSREQALPAFLFPGRDAHHRQIKAPGEGCAVHPDAPALRLVHKIDTDKNSLAEFPALKHQVQVPLQAAGVADHHNRLRLIPEQIVPGHPLLLGMGQERIGPRQIHQAVIPAAAHGGGDGLAGPVAGMLSKAGQAVEKGTFAHVGIARQGYDAFHGSTSTSMRQLSERRRAMAAPQMR